MLRLGGGEGRFGVQRLGSEIWIQAFRAQMVDVNHWLSWGSVLAFLHIVGFKLNIRDTEGVWKGLGGGLPLNPLSMLQTVTHCFPLIAITLPPFLLLRRCNEVWLADVRW